MNVLDLFSGIGGFSRHRGGSEFGAAWWTEPDVGRVAYGLPAQVDRLRSLGNAVVPQIPEIIGRAIMSAHAKCNVDGCAAVTTGDRRDG